MFVLGMGIAHMQLLRHPGWQAPRLLVLAATLAGTAGVFLKYGTLLGRNAGVALLVVMLALKLLELRRLRDVQLMIFLNYFLVITNFLFTQTPLIALYMLAAAVVNTAALGVATQTRSAHPVIPELRFATVLLIQALPVMLVLFVFFPRISGPIWGLPKDAHSGVTGLSDSMTPGAISQLAHSESPAFRVRFSGSAPPPSQRYWRGPVLWHTDGRTWSTGRMAVLQRPVVNPVVQADGEAVHQSITLEGQASRWLIGLDVPVEVSAPAIITAGFQWLSKRSLRERTRYEVVSYPRFRNGSLDPRLEEAALLLPDTVSTRVRALARSWRDKARIDRDVVRLALDYFHNEPFIYTLTPPLLGENTLEEFLFASRRGFCEHYAAAFVVLMRSASIPARVVTGYQGGEYNPVGNYWLIRQSDAHAWAEVWLPETGWERVDPTAAVAPERIEHALDLASLSPGAPARFQVGEDGLFSLGWRRLRYSLDAINNSWDQWVLSYGPELQRDVLAALGFNHPSWKNMTLMLVLLVSTLLIGIAGWLLLKKPVISDPVLRTYQRFCERAAGLGIRRRNSEGPQDFSRRIVIARPELERQVDRITEVFILLRYGQSGNPARDLDQLRRLVRHFPRGKT